MREDDVRSNEWVLSDEVVREAIESLTSVPVHQQFILYLQLRRAAVEAGRFERLRQDNEVIRRWLHVPGGPPEKPNFRPFVNTKDPKPSAFWMNRNLAGSYAQSSLRQDVKEVFVAPDGGYRIPTDADGSPNAKLIFEKFLGANPLPAWALAAYLFRNVSFEVRPDGAHPGASSLLSVFQEYFNWTGTHPTSGQDERSLFNWEASPSTDVIWLRRDGGNAGVGALPDTIEIGESLPARDASRLGIGYRERAGRATGAPDAPDVDADDPAVLEVIEVIDQYWGAILSGPPGTSKSHRASAAARAIADFDPGRFAFTQFHQSYQFDDFIEGYRPREDGEGFERRLGVFTDFCERARLSPDQLFAFVIDELSRGDVGRIFGEVLTYIERSRRNQLFVLPSGRTFSIPDNIRIIATMNPLDRGVDEVDAAFERRFGKIATNPDPDLLRARLQENQMAEPLVFAVLRWFDAINSQIDATPMAAVGHTYFWEATDEDSLGRIWKYQLSHLVERAFRLEPSLGTKFARDWHALLAPADEVADATVETDPTQ